MTRIDRYLLFLYSRVFLICFMTLSGLLVVIQVFTNLDELIAFGKVRGSFMKGLAEYFGPYLLSIFDRMCGLLTLLAMMFVVAWLYRTHEMTALLAAGISKGRIIRPILVLSAILIVLAAISRETLIPRHSDMLSKSPQELVGDKDRPIRPTEDVEQGVWISGLNLHPASKSISQPIFRFHGPAVKVTAQLTGSLAKHMEANNDHPGGFLVSDAVGTDSITGKRSVNTAEGLFLLLPADTPWLKSNECFVPTSIEFDALRGGGAKQYASTGDLIWRIQNQPHFYGSELKVAIHARFVQPFLDFTQLLIGIPMILSNRGRSLVSMIISCVLSFVLFFGISIGLHTLGANETLLTPAAAAWAPLLIFGPLAWCKASSSMQS
ncbi:MAG: LptF/LptG family permease [Pirellula sp.]